MISKGAARVASTVRASVGWSLLTLADIKEEKTMILGRGPIGVVGMARSETKPASGATVIT